jgi:hypothetical protein
MDGTTIATKAAVIAVQSQDARERLAGFPPSFFMPFKATSVR